MRLKLCSARLLNSISVMVVEPARCAGLAGDPPARAMKRGGHRTSDQRVNDPATFNRRSLGTAPEPALSAAASPRAATPGPGSLVLGPCCERHQRDHGKSVAAPSECPSAAASGRSDGNAPELSGHGRAARPRIAVWVEAVEQLLLARPGDRQTRQLDVAITADRARH